ncbi:MAG: zinc ribbon domain-containing protein [Candidatus Micrarchaeota archaeon]
MGLGDLLGNMLKGGRKIRGEPQKCPNCGEMVTLDQERCRKCGVRIKSMFRRKCPRCGNLNELDAPKCTKCFYGFEAEEQRTKKTYYVCPICGNKSEVFLTRCVVCGTRFM